MLFGLVALVVPLQALGFGLPLLAVGEKIAGLIPQARFALMHHCGHWPQFEDAATFNRIHLEFLGVQP